MTAVIRGDYSYNTIPASILQTVQRYIPSLLTLNENMPVPHNNFKFDIRVNNTEFFQKLFQIPLELKFPASIKGYFNDREEKLRVEGHFPAFKYNGTHYDSGYSSAKIRQTGSNVPQNRYVDEQWCNGESYCRYPSQKRPAGNNCQLGNNTNVTYGGKFAAVTRFYKTEGKHPILQADINIKPTKVVLNDTIWNIHPSHIAVDSGRVYIDNFLFEHENQHLRINGKLTKARKTPAISI